MLFLSGSSLYTIIGGELNENVVNLFVQRILTCLVMSYFLKFVYNAREDLKDEQTPILDEDQAL